MLGDKIKQLRLAHGLTQTAFAKKLYVTPGAVSQWEKGITSPDTERLLQIASTFSVSLDFFTDPEETDLITNTIRIRKNAVPILGAIACGDPITAQENMEGYADLPDGIRADFALRCKGESMVPTFLDGDLVLIRVQPDVDDGQIAAVSIDGEATLKHVYHQSGGLMLVADNPSYSPIYALPQSDRQIIIHGLAVGYTRIF